MELGFAVDGIKGYYSYFTLSVNRWGSEVSAGVERGTYSCVSCEKDRPSSSPVFVLSLVVLLLCGEEDLA